MCARSAARIAQQNDSRNRTRSPSSSGRGLRPLTAATGVRIPLGTPYKQSPAEQPGFVCMGFPRVQQNPSGFDRIAGSDPARAKRVPKGRGPWMARAIPLGTPYKQSPAEQPGFSHSTAPATADPFGSSRSGARVLLLPRLFHFFSRFLYILPGAFKRIAAGKEKRNRQQNCRQNSVLHVEVPPGKVRYQCRSPTDSCPTTAP